MHKHILIPTDGSDLSEQAVNYGVALAKAVSAKVTAITVSTPFHVFAADPDMLTDTPESYKKRMTTIATKYLGQAKDAAAEAKVSCDIVHVENEHPFQVIIDTEDKRVRFDSNGLPWAARDLCNCAG
jgi:nucleotide-binding universal stress UspA family protein